METMTNENAVATADALMNLKKEMETCPRNKVSGTHNENARYARIVRCVKTLKALGHDRTEAYKMAYAMIYDVA